MRAGIQEINRQKRKSRMIKQLKYMGNVRLGNYVLEKQERVETGRQRIASQPPVLSPNLNYPVTLRMFTVLPLGNHSPARTLWQP